MKMDSLQNLHSSMILEKLDMQQFRIKIGIAEFDCLFSTREAPFIFSMTSRGLHSKFFKFEVKKGYWISDSLGAIYYDLAKVLKKDGSSGNKLYPNDFMKEVNELIPHNAKKSAKPSAEDIIKIRPDLEESEKPYFDTWIYWKKDGKQSPRAENQHKTKVAYGQEALDYSILMNASTKWSRTPTGRSWLTEKK